jgi:hypothetical protein
MVATRKHKVATRPAQPVLMGVREYARYRGVSHTAVQKAIHDERIEKRADGKIDRDAADAAWPKNTLPRSTEPESAPSVPEAAAGPEASADGGVSKSNNSENADTEDTDLDRGNLSFTQARAAKETFLARLRRLEWQQKAGILVDAEQVRKAQSKLLRAVRDRLLEVPDRLADELAAESDPSLVHEMLRTELRAVLIALSAELRTLGGGPAEEGAA